MGERPTNVEEYVAWLRRDVGFEPFRQHENHYVSAASSARDALQASSFWGGLPKELEEANADYKLEHEGFDLVQSFRVPAIEIKRYPNAVEKTFRANVLQNSKWPKPASDRGWVLPTPECFDLLGDVVRTQLVVKYVDGVEYLSERLRIAAEADGFEYSMDLEAREHGYYAAHIALKKAVSLPRIDWDTKSVSMVYEVQVTTQLQEVIYRLTHKNYENRRIRIPTSEHERPWQWELGSREFAANYIGHILHYLEVVILDVRTKQEEES